MKKVALGALLVFVIGIVGLFTVSGSVLSFGKNTEINERETISAKGIKEMKINVDVGEIRIKESKNEEIDIHLHGSISKKVRDQLKFKVEQHSSSVEVVIRQSNKFFVQIPFINSDLNSESILDVSLPKSLLDKLEMKTDVGEIHIDDINPAQLIAHSDVGDIYVNQFSGIGNFATDVGEIELENISGSIDAHTDTGDIDIGLIEMTDDIDLSSDVGEVSVTITKEPDNIAFDLSSELGEVSISGFKGNGNTSSGNIITQIGSDGPLLKAKTELGDITIKK